MDKDIKKRVGDLKKRKRLEYIISVLILVFTDIEFVSHDFSNVPLITYNSMYLHV